MTAYQLSDDWNSDGETARYVTFDVADRFYLGEFVMVSCATTSRRYFGVVVSHALNIARGVLGPTDATTLNQIELIASDRLARDVAVTELWITSIQLLGDVTSGGIQSVTRRPLTTATVIAATAAEVRACLNLPLDTLGAPGSIGVIRNTDIAMHLSQEILFRHCLVAGATGYGKSNMIANSIFVQAMLGHCVIVLDHKPDFQDIHHPNDDRSVEFAYGLPDVKYYAIGDEIDVFSNGELPISVPFAELDPAVLAATLFYQPLEYNMKEYTEEMIADYLANNPGQNRWAFLAWLKDLPNAKASPIPVDTRTFDAMRAKISRVRGSRWPDWIDAGVNIRRGALVGGVAQAAPPFDLERLIRPGRVIVIRVPRQMNSARSYGLLLAYLLDRISLLKATRRVGCPLGVIADEAGVIFKMGGRQFSAAAENNFDRNMSHGRSLGIGYTLGVQAANQVPEQIMNNLLSRIILHHESVEELRAAASRASEAQRHMTNSFGPGEALVSLFGARSIVHAQLRRSPMKLTVFDV